MGLFEEYMGIEEDNNTVSETKGFEGAASLKFTNKEKTKKEEMVNHPSHYTSGNIEVIDYIEDQKLPYHLGNVVKYISRAGKKTKGIENEIIDLEKAQWYLNRYIELLKKEQD